MGDRSARWILLAMTLAVPLILAGCFTPSAEVPSVAPSPSSSQSPSALTDQPRFIIECVGPGGRAVGPFTSLEDAWASPDYVRIDSCTASAAAGESLELSPEEQVIAEIAAVDLAAESLEELYATTLATCVRVTPTSSVPLKSLPTSLLEAANALCPQAPHAGLIEAELMQRGP